MMTFGAEPEIELLMLCDHAQAINSKLFLMGGGWEQMYLASVDHPIMLNYALALQVPWNCTNQDFNVLVRVETPDRTELSKATYHFNQGRPSGSWIGEPQRIQFVSTIVATLPDFGGYYLVAQIEGSEHSRRVGFRAIKP